MKTTAKIMAMLLVLALVGSTSARVITVEVTGVVDYFNTVGGFALDGSVGLGSTMTGFCTYDTETPDELPVNEDLGFYPVILISMTIGNYTFIQDAASPDSPHFKVYSAVDLGYVVSGDASRFDGTVYINGSPKTYEDITWSWTHLALLVLGTSSSEYIPTDALPDLDSWPDLSVFDMGRDFETRFDEEGGGYFQIYGEITSLTVIPEPPKTYYVNAAEGSDDNDGLSPETPFATIQKAIDSAFNGDTVIVADGTYTGDGNRDIDFKGKAITVRSENGPENCIIDCQGAEEDQHRGFYFHSGEKPSSTIHGFTITGGFAKNTQPDPPWPYPPLTKYGGGIYCKWACPTITNCVVSGNLADSGGGICVDNLPGWPPFNPTIANCLISGNSATRDGGGIYCTPGTIVENCTIFGNRAAKAGGGYCSRSSSDLPPEYEGSLPPSGPEYDSEIINCIFFDNLSNQGPQIAAGSPQTSPPTPPPPWPPPWWPGFGNYPTEVLSEQTDTNLPVLSVKYSDIQGGQDGLHVGYDRDLKWGQGNIDLDPCFVEPGYWADADDPNIIVEPNDPNAIWIDGDYHLLLDSPCIDSGDNNSVPADIHDLDGDGNTAEPLPFDLDGNPRFVDRPDIEDTGNGTPPIVDMGAYEAMASCFGVNHVKLGTKAGKKGNKVEVKGTFDPASPIDFARDDVMYSIKDSQGHTLTFIIPAGSFEQEGKPDKQKFRFHSAKGSQPGIKARFDFLKCKFELKVKEVMDTSEITAETLAIVLQAGANLVEEVVQVQAKPKHLEFKREPKLNCCPEM